MTTRTVAVNYTANVAPYVAGVNQASAATGGLATKTGAASKGLGGLARAAVGPTLAIAGPAGLVMGLKSAVTASLEFEDEMTKLKTQIGLTTEEVEGMRRAALSLGGATTKGPQELAEATFFIASAGLRGAEALDVLRSSAQLSAIGLGDTAVVADVLTSAVNAYGSEVLSAASASDVLVNAVRLGKASADDLAGSIGKVLPIASAMGARFDEVSGIVAAMTKTGTDAATATTQLRAMMVSILKPAEQAEQAFREFGLSGTELRATIQEEGLWAALMELHEAVGANSAAYAEMFPNVRALAGVMDLLGPQLESNKDLMAEMADSAGIAGEAYAEFSLTTRGELQKLGAEVDATMVRLGGATDGLVNSSVRGIRRFFTNWADAWSGVQDEQWWQLERLGEIEAGIQAMEQATRGLTGAQLDAAKDTALYRAGLNSVNDAISRLGHGLTRDLLGGMDEYNALREIGSAEDAEAYRQLLLLIGAAENYVDTTATLPDHLTGYGQAASDAADDTGNLGLEVELATLALEEHVAAIDAAASAHAAAVDPIAGAIKAQEDYREALSEVNRLQGEGKTGTDEFRDAMLDLISAEGDLRTAISESGLTFGEFVTDYLDPAIERLGLTDDEAQNLRNAFGGIGSDLEGLDINPFMERMGYLINTQGDLQTAFEESGMSVDDFKTEVLLKLREAGDLSADEFYNMILEVNGYRDRIDEATGAVRDLAEEQDDIDGRHTESAHTHTVTTIERTIRGDAPGLGVAGVRAMGGPVLANRPYLVGEQGPEIVLPSVAGTVMNAGQVAALSGMGSGRGIVVENYNTYRQIDDDALLSRLEWAQEVGRL